MEIPWSEWKNNLQESLKAIKEVNHREEAAIGEKEINKAIEKRCSNFKTNQERMINSLTNQTKNNIIVNKILVKK